MLDASPTDATPEAPRDTMSDKPRNDSEAAAPLPARAWSTIAVLVVGYIGIYLCRKNLSVAIPLLQKAFGTSKEQLGAIASVSTAAYLVGKFVNGPVIDALGARRGLVGSMLLVAVFGALGGFAPSIGVLIVLYSLNRFAGSASWGAMVKLVPTWFAPATTGTAVGVLSLSYVVGGALAAVVASQIVAVGGGWHAVMALPSLILVVLVMVTFFAVRVGPLAAPAKEASSPAPHVGATIARLFGRRAFWVTCALSLTLTLTRESFNTWSVDFLASIQKGAVHKAAWQSTLFDLAGGVAIIAFGFAYDRIAPSARKWLVAACLALLAGVVAALPVVAASSPWGAAWLVGAVGLLVYGPYSLLAGALAIEAGGVAAAATAAGVIDGIGYAGAMLAGAPLGRLLDAGGYGLGFRVLAAIMAASAVVALGLGSGETAKDK